jgi:hypothetical protein
MRVAFSSILLNTGSSSPGDELMTCNTSEVAVCCSSASANSRWSVAIRFFKSISAGARLRLVGVLRAAGALRTDFPRFTIDVRSGPGKASNKNGISPPNLPN